MTKSFEAGILAAKQGDNINNSYPHNHEEFVQGYRSVNNNAEEDLNLKALSMNLSPEDYPYIEVPGELTRRDLYLFRQKGSIHSANVDDHNLKVLNELLKYNHVVKVQLK